MSVNTNWVTTHQCYPCPFETEKGRHRLQETNHVSLFNGPHKPLQDSRMVSAEWSNMSFFPKSMAAVDEIFKAAFDTHEPTSEVFVSAKLLSLNGYPATYTGNLVQGSPHGQGVAIFSKGDIYDGQWVHGKRQGDGSIFYANGDKYVGQWWNDVIQGYGKRTDKNSNSYEGPFVDGKEHGLGNIRLADGSEYRCEWERGVLKMDSLLGAASSEMSAASQNISALDSCGMEDEYVALRKITLSNSTHVDYTGWMQKGLPHGMGTGILADGSQYDGQWKHGDRDGSGELICPDGTYYKGQFVESKAEGYGVAVLEGGITYKGYWKDGVFNGRGRICSVDLKSYEGEWRDGKKQGQGKAIFGSNVWYEGEWKNDQFHGMGQMHDENGDVYIGYWKKGVMHGQGTMTFISGETLTGQWKKGRFLQSDTSSSEDSSKETEFSCPFIAAQESGLPEYIEID